MRQNPAADLEGLSPALRARLSKIMKLDRAIIMRPMTREERKQKALDIIAERAGGSKYNVGDIQGTRVQEYWRRKADEYLEESMRDKSLEEIQAAIDASDELGSGSKTIKKDQIYPIPSGEEFKEAGVNSGTAWSKRYIHKSFTPSVKNIKEKIVYTQFLKHLMEGIEHAATNEELNVFFWEALKEEAQLIMNSEIVPEFIKTFGEDWKHNLLEYKGELFDDTTKQIFNLARLDEDTRLMRTGTPRNNLTIRTRPREYLQQRMRGILDLAGKKFGGVFWVLHSLDNIKRRGHDRKKFNPNDGLDKDPESKAWQTYLDQYMRHLKVGNAATNTGWENLRTTPRKLDKYGTPTTAEVFGTPPYTLGNDYREIYPGEEAYYDFDPKGFAIDSDGKRVMVAAPVEHQDWKWINSEEKVVKEGGIINLTIEQEPYGRDGPDLPDGGFLELCLMGLDAVHFGGESYMDEAARNFHTRSMFAAFQDMSDIIGIPYNMLGRSLCMEGGNLKIALGAMGRGRYAGAFFSPSQNVIAMTKKRGEGALGHEWMHYLDSQLGYLLEAGMRANGLNPSDYRTIWTGRKNKEGYYYRYHYLSAVLGANPYGRVGENLPIRRGNKLVHRKDQTPDERRITDGVLKSMKLLLWTIYYKHTIKKGTINEFNPTKKGECTSTKYSQDAYVIGKQYWLCPWEMVARAYEVWLADSLEEAVAKRKNTYLVGRKRTLQAVKVGVLEGTWNPRAMFGYAQDKYSFTWDNSEHKRQLTERHQIKKAMTRFMQDVAAFYKLCEVPMHNSTIEELRKADFVKHIVGNQALGQGDKDEQSIIKEQEKPE
jgi:hypothetical protein